MQLRHYGFGPGFCKGFGFRNDGLFNLSKHCNNPRLSRWLQHGAACSLNLMGYPLCLVPGFGSCHSSLLASLTFPAPLPLPRPPLLPSCRWSSFARRHATPERSAWPAWPGWESSPAISRARSELLTRCTGEGSFAKQGAQCWARKGWAI